MSRRRFQNPTPKLEWGNWYIFPREDYQQPDGTVKRKTIRVLLGSAGKMNFKQAEREAAAQMQHLNSLNYRPRSGKTFAEFAEEWMETCMIAPAYSPSSMPSMKSGIRRHLVGILGSLELAEIGPEHVDRFIKVASQGVKDEQGNVVRKSLGAKSIRNLLFLLEPMEAKAHTWGYIHGDTNWFNGVKKPRARRGKGRVFTEAQVIQILDAAPEREAVYYWLVAATGMRAGEISGLTRQDVDVAERKVSVTHSVWRGKGKDTKTETSRRDFIVSCSLTAALAGVMAKVQDTSPTGYIFHTSNGTPWSPELIVKRKLRPLLKKLGIPHAGLHAFRHAVGTEWERRGVPLKAIQDQLGHSSPSTTTDFYLHSISADRVQAGEQWADDIAPSRWRGMGQVVIPIHPADFGLLLEGEMAAGKLKVHYHPGTRECTVAGKRYRITREVAPTAAAQACGGQSPQSMATVGVVGLEKIRGGCSVGN